MTFKLVFSCLIFFTLHMVFGQDKEDFLWPNGAKSAICLTYDDGLSSHVNTVAPLLSKYNFKATFYPTLSSVSIREEIKKWKALAKAGHELGNHTVYHPCRKSREGMEWVKDYQDLDRYSLNQIVDEIELANSFLLAIDGKKDRTFAYPCAHFKASGISYQDSLFKRFIGARGSSDQIKLMVDSQKIDLFNVPSWAPNQHTAAELIAYIDEVIANETLSTLTFHGVGAEYLSISKDTHEEMLKYLDLNRDKIWVATFQEAANYLRLMQKKN